MKKTASVLLLLVILFTFAGCGGKNAMGNNIPEVDDCKWVMSFISKRSGEIVALGKDNNTSFKHDVEIELTATFRRGVIKIKDITNGKTYKGEFTDNGVNLDKREYSFVVDGVQGYGSTSIREYFDGDSYYKAPGLSMQLGEYSLIFEAVKK